MVSDKISVSTIDRAGSEALSGGVILLRRFIIVGGLHCCQFSRSAGNLWGSFSASSFNCSGERFSPIRFRMLDGRMSKSSE